MARPRLSKSMLARHQSAAALLVSLYMDSIRAGDPMDQTGDRAMAIIDRAGPLTTYLSADLYSRRATLREVSIRHSVWVLYVDGERVTTDQIGDRRDAGDESIWRRVCGRHEWPNGRPFYSADDDPAPSLRSN